MPFMPYFAPQTYNELDDSLQPHTNNAIDFDDDATHSQQDIEVCHPRALPPLDSFHVDLRSARWQNASSCLPSIEIGRPEFWHFWIVINRTVGRRYTAHSASYL